MSIPAVDRILARCVRQDRGYSTPCLIFTGYLTEKGYGRIQTGSQKDVRRTHRVIYEHHHGPLPTGHEPDHLCRQHDCCEITHLEGVPHRTNLLRGSHDHVRLHHAGVCHAGHPMSGNNLSISKGHRSCRECRRERLRKAKAVPA